MGAGGCLHPHLTRPLPPSPQGTPKRWEQVTAYIRTRTLEEVLLMVKEKQGMSASRVRQQEDFKAGQTKRAGVTSQVRGRGGKCPGGGRRGWGSPAGGQGRESIRGGRRQNTPAPPSCIFTLVMT